MPIPVGRRTTKGWARVVSVCILIAVPRIFRPLQSTPASFQPPPYRHQAASTRTCHVPRVVWYHPITCGCGGNEHCHVACRVHSMHQQYVETTDERRHVRHRETAHVAHRTRRRRLNQQPRICPNRRSGPCARVYVARERGATPLARERCEAAQLALQQLHEAVSSCPHPQTHIQ